MDTERATALPPPLDTLDEGESAAVVKDITPVRFAAGECIYRMGSPGDACYIIDKGVVRVDLDRGEHLTHSDIDTDHTLEFIEPGGILGELSLLDRLPRSNSAYAQTDVAARQILAGDIDTLAEAHPRAALALYTALGRSAAVKLRHSHDRVAHLAFHGEPDPEVGEMVARAVQAQREIVRWPEQRIDALLRAMAEAVASRAKELAIANVEETGLGRVESKIVKNTVASLGAYNFVAGKTGFGPLSTDETRAVTEIASPAGVIVGLIPQTNPVSTTIFKSIIALKGRNALILSPNRQAAGVSTRVVDLLRDILKEHEAPEDLIQIVHGAKANRRKTAELMAHPDVSLVLATGGAGMVKAAYSSGTPAIGVGPGNTPALICEDAEPSFVAEAILLSKTFDNGMPCGSEHNLVVVAAARDALIRELTKRGTAVLSDEEQVSFGEWAVDPHTGKFRVDIIGQDADKIAAWAGITRDYPIRLIVVPSEEIHADSPYAREKMAPLLSLFTVASPEEGIEVCRQLLTIDGCGHTASIHTNDSALAQRFGEAMPASRILVNTPSVHGMLGLTTGLQLSATLGCGTFGGTSTTDNVQYYHLLNIKRLAHFLPESAAAWKDLI